VARLDRDAIRRAIEHHALLTSRDSVLFELTCAFDVMRILRRQGWGEPHATLFKPPLIYIGTRGNAKLHLYFQHAPADLTVDSVYRRVQKNHSFIAIGGLIPDLVLRIKTPSATRLVMLEVKWGVQRDVAQLARAALSDLMGYRRAFNKSLSDQSGPYGIGYVWGEGLLPASDSEVLLCTPDTLEDALPLVLEG
jgi:hypothetical protein